MPYPGARRRKEFVLHSLHTKAIVIGLIILALVVIRIKGYFS